MKASKGCLCFLFILLFLVAFFVNDQVPGALPAWLLGAVRVQPGVPTVPVTNPVARGWWCPGGSGAAPCQPPPQPRCPPGLSSASCHPWSWRSRAAVFVSKLPCLCGWGAEQPSHTHYFFPSVWDRNNLQLLALFFCQNFSEEIFVLF